MLARCSIRQRVLQILAEARALHWVQHVLPLLLFQAQRAVRQLAQPPAYWLSHRWSLVLLLAQELVHWWPQVQAPSSSKLGCNFHREYAVSAKRCVTDSTWLVVVVVVLSITERAAVMIRGRL